MQFKVKNFGSVTVDAESENGRIRDLFSAHWEKVSETLNLMRTIVKNPLAKIAISIVIGIGDGIFWRITEKEISLHQ
jgi:hypothetical protein